MVPVKVEQLNDDPFSETVKPNKEEKLIKMLGIPIAHFKILRKISLFDSNH
jgi:hypothetical protein